MKLSESFSIDPAASWVKRHNDEARQVLAAYNNDRPIRVPLLLGEWPGQHGFYAEETKLDYRRYYDDPHTMLRVQLEAARRRRELPIADHVLAEAPERWPLAVDFWPVVAPGWAGCELLYRSDAVIAHKGLRLSKEECEKLEMPDPARGNLLSVIERFWAVLRREGAELKFLGRPVGPVGSGVGSNGFFSLALDFRGEEIMADCYDDADFARRFLRKIAGWIVKLDEVWGAGPGAPAFFPLSDHGIDMLSPQVYEGFIVPIIKEMNQRGGTVPKPFLHHCGRGAHLFPIIKKHFGLEHIQALTFPLVDIAKVRRDLGEEARIEALIEEPIIRQGPVSAIRQAVKELLKAKGRGRFALIVGDLLPGVPLEHRIAFYEAVKEFGRYP